MYLGTFFFRNRPELALMARLCQRVASGGKPVRIAVVGCSNGAEVYSIAYTLRSTHPELGFLCNGRIPLRLRRGSGRADARGAGSRLGTR
jgi:hypothetical protein